MCDYEGVKRIIEGEFPLDTVPDHKGEISNKFFFNLENTVKDWTEVYVPNGPNDEIKRIFAFKKFFEWVPFKDKDLKSYRKNKRTATILREIGKVAQVQKNHKEALKYYNLAIVFAPYAPNHKDENKDSFLDEDLSKEFIEMVATRAEILLHVRGGEEALRDAKFLLGLLEKAKDYNCDTASPFVQEMDTRVKAIQTDCLKFLEEKASFMMELAKDSVDEMEKRRKYKNLLLFRIKKPNPLIPVAEAFVDIKVDPIKGRSLVVSRDIPAGTTVVVEEPFVKVLKGGLKWDLGHCHFCLLKIRGGGGVPCPTCVFETYCSEECRNEGWTRYHRWECPCLPYLYFTSTPRYVHLAIRIVCTIGPKETYRMFITKDPKYFRPQKEDTMTCFGCNPSTGVYDSSSYLSIYHLVAHPPKGEVEFLTNIIQGLIFAHVLESLSTFFDEPKYLETHPKEYFRTFVACLILHHMENIPPNSISVDEVTGLEGISLLVKEPTTLQERIRKIQHPQVASAAYALSSLINHSCDPNVTRLHDLTHGRMALVTLKGLKAGEELVTSYTKIFLSDTTEERREYLQKTYSFICDCIACSQRWPILAKISETEPRFCCAACVKKLQGNGDSSKNSPAFTRTIMDKKGACRGCKKTHNMDHLKDLLDQKIEVFFEAYDLILKNKPLEAVRLVGPCAQFFQDNVCPPYNKIYMSQDLLKTALDLVIHYSVPRT